jgi:hypothetical protein
MTAALPGPGARGRAADITAPLVEDLRVTAATIPFDGTLSPDGGALAPDESRSGLGLELKRSELERHAI